jgi:hypothetical protein
MGKDFVLSIIFWTKFFMLTRFPGLRFRSGPPCGGLAAPPFQSGVGSVCFRAYFFLPRIYFDSLKALAAAFAFRRLS